jgi:hypothetical protein
MPCKSDYLEPTQREMQLRHTAKLLIYTLKALDQPVPLMVRHAAATAYCTQDYVPTLCATIKAMSEEQLGRIVYDGRNPEARELANWWDRHKRADQEREAREAKARRMAVLRREAKAKLSPDELEALTGKRS